MLWHTAHGEPFRFTTLEGATFAPEGIDPGRIRRPHSLLAFHVEPILLALALPFRLWPDPRLLLWLQALVLAAGALPMAWLGRELVGGRAAPVAFGAAWLLAPGIEGAALSDFHAVALAATWLAAALWLLESARRRAALVLFALAALSREDAALVVASIGGTLYLGSRGRVWSAEIGRVGAWLALGAGAWAALCFAVVMPLFSGGGSLFLVRYAWLWRDPGSAPWGDVAAYLALQLLTGGVLCLLAPLPMLAAAPLLAMNALSGFDWMRSGGAHYSALLVPVLLWAAAHGIRRLRELGSGETAQGAPPRATVHLARRAGLLVLLLAALGAHAWAGASPLRPGFVWPERDARAASVRAGLALVPEGAPLAASSGLVPHLSGRDAAGWFPAGVDAAEWVVVDAVGTTHPLTAAETRGALRGLVGDGGFGVAAARDGLVVLRRGAPTAVALEPFAPEPPAPERPPMARFGTALELVDVRLRRWPEVGLFGDAGTLETLWRAAAPIPDDLVFALATTRRPDGALVGLEADAAAAALWHPTSRWRPGELVRLEMPVSRLARYEGLGVAVVDAAGARLPVHLPAGSRLPRWEGETVLGLVRPSV